MPTPTVVPSADARPVFGYVRVSTDHQDLARQERTIPEAHARLPDGLATKPLELFSDQGISAYSGKRRPDFEAMKARIERGEASALIVDTSSRLTRQGIRAALTLFFKLEDARCRLFTTQGREYPFDAHGIVSLILDADRDNAYSRDLSHNVRTGIAARARAGRWPYGQKPYGYRLDSEAGVLHVHETEAETVRLVFRRFDRGESITAIARDIGRTRGNVPNWLDNPVYIGLIPLGDELVEGKHEPIIEPELWERVRKRRRQNAEIQARYSRVQPYGSLLRCNKCGRPTNFHRGKGESTYYRCENTACRAYVAIPEYVDAAVVIGLATVGLTLHERLDDPTWAVTKPNTERLAEVEAELARVTAAEADILGLITDRVLDRTSAKPELALLTRERESLEAARARLADDGRKLRTDLEALRDTIAALAELEHPDERLLGRLVTAWRNADIETRKRVLDSVLERIDIRDESLLLSFRAGITIPVPLKTGRRNRTYTQPLLALGFGRPGRSPPSGFSLLGRGARVSRRTCRDAHGAVPGATVARAPCASRRDQPTRELGGPSRGRSRRGGPAASRAAGAS